MVAAESCQQRSSTAPAYQHAEGAWRNTPVDPQRSTPSQVRTAHAARPSTPQTGPLNPKGRSSERQDTPPPPVFAAYNVSKHNHQPTTERPAIAFARHKQAKPRIKASIVCPHFCRRRHLLQTHAARHCIAAGVRAAYACRLLISNQSCPHQQQQSPQTGPPPYQQTGSAATQQPPRSHWAQPQALGRRGCYANTMQPAMQGTTTAAAADHHSSSSSRDKAVKLS